MMLFSKKNLKYLNSSICLRPSRFSIPFYEKTTTTFLIVNSIESLGLILSSNAYLLLQFFFISTNWYIITFIEDVNRCIRDLNNQWNNQHEIEKSFLEIIKFHLKILQKMKEIQSIINVPVFTSNFFNQIMLFCTMYQMHTVSSDELQSNLLLDNIFIHFQSIKYSDFQEFHQGAIAYLCVIEQQSVLYTMGQFATSKYFSMNDEFYQTVWYKFPVKIQKDFIMFFRQAQQSYVYKGNSLTKCLLPTIWEVRKTILGLEE